ncbi:hypothetical protein SSCH_410002 [Syntrophaceticus schinkii]|uniref:Uncharacterized protein n=1 Tax=Syntrophaceticus schinkii TaxID=499207 RepID=A0A0B7MLW8_9FIRM|nr:hypothetical protein SSCH_410002 [Syntrophaceticus schinkii]
MFFREGGLGGRAIGVPLLAIYPSVMIVMSINNPYVNQYASFTSIKKQEKNSSPPVIGSERRHNIELSLFAFVSMRSS